VVAVEHADLISLQRSTAMLTPGERASVSREDLLDVLEELIATRQLLSRLGGDLKAVARRSSS
jgi:hypothetical protein